MAELGTFLGGGRGGSGWVAGLTEYKAYSAQLELEFELSLTIMLHSYTLMVNRFVMILRFYAELESKVLIEDHLGLSLLAKIMSAHFLA